MRERERERVKELLHFHECPLVLFTVFDFQYVNAHYTSLQATDPIVLTPFQGHTDRRSSVLFLISVDTMIEDNFQHCSTTCAAALGPLLALA